MRKCGHADVQSCCFLGNLRLQLIYSDLILKRQIIRRFASFQHATKNRQISRHFLVIDLCENGLIRIIHPQVFSGIHSQIIVLVKLQEKLLNFTKNKLHFRCSVNFTEFFIIVFSRTSPFNCFWLISEFSKTRESVLGTFLVT